MNQGVEGVEWKRMEMRRSESGVVGGDGRKRKGAEAFAKLTKRTRSNLDVCFLASYFRTLSVICLVVHIVTWFAMHIYLSTN